MLKRGTAWLEFQKRTFLRLAKVPRTMNPTRFRDRQSAGKMRKKEIRKHSLQETPNQFTLREQGLKEVCGNHLISPEMEEQLSSANPDFERIRTLVLDAFNIENGKEYSLDEITKKEQAEVIRWMNKAFRKNKDASQTVERLALATTTVRTPFFSASLSHKILNLAQFHCPLCRVMDGIISVIPIRISAISKQAAANRKGVRKAFEKAIAHNFKHKPLRFEKGDKLCVCTIFVLGKGNRDKDLDNMSKALMDALEGILFSSDMDIVHSNLIKFNCVEGESFIQVNIRKSNLHEHDDVLFQTMAHGWAGQPTLCLNEFMSED